MCWKRVTRQMYRQTIPRLNQDNNETRGLFLSTNEKNDAYEEIFIVRVEIADQLYWRNSIIHTQMFFSFFFSIIHTQVYTQQLQSKKGPLF